jgi:hypothetical protein
MAIFKHFLKHPIVKETTKLFTETTVTEEHKEKLVKAGERLLAHMFCGKETQFLDDGCRHLY